MRPFKIFHALVLITTIFTTSLIIGSESSSPESHRTKYNFNPDWKFIQANPGDVQGIDFDDSTWNTISCPHTFNDVDSFDDLSDGSITIASFIDDDTMGTASATTLATSESIKAADS